MSIPLPHTDVEQPPLVADHLALDLLNTEAGAGDLHRDFWTSDADVLAWLRRNGIEAADALADAGRHGLLDEARRLRANARALVELRKQDRRGDPAGLNRYLALLRSKPVLAWGADGPRLERRVDGDSPLLALGIVAESVASLLAEGDFALVRQCEHPDCVLWFYDRTKSHRRRWCSMAVCGNRHKAAEFRRRSRAAA